MVGLFVIENFDETKVHFEYDRREIIVRIKQTVIVLFGIVSHIPKFGDASKSPSGDTTSPAGDAASLSRDAVVSHWRPIISFRDAHPPHSHPYLP